MQKKSEWLFMFLIGMYLLSMLLSFVFYGGLGGSLKESYQIGLFSCVFLLPLWLFLYQIEWEMKKPKQVCFFALLFFGFTMVFILVSTHINTCLLWIGGCIFLTVLFPIKIGIAFFLFFGCLFCFINDATISYEIFMFLLGIILCSLVFFIKQGKPRLLVVFLSMIAYTLLFFILTQGNRAYFTWQSLLSMMGQVVFLMASYHLYSVLKRTEILFDSDV